MVKQIIPPMSEIPTRWKIATMMSHQDEPMLAQVDVRMAEFLFDIRQLETMLIGSWFKKIVSINSLMMVGMFCVSRIILSYWGGGEQTTNTSCPKPQYGPRSVHAYLFRSKQNNWSDKMSNRPRVPHRMPLYSNVSSQPPCVPSPDEYKSAEFKSWYQTRWWKIVRREWLRMHPHCCMCLERGIEKKAKIVDHRIPHRGNRLLFFNWFNLQSLCYWHHNSVKAASEARGIKHGAKLDGSPLTPADGW